MRDPYHRREINPVQRLSAYGDHADSLRGSGAFQRQGLPPGRGERLAPLDAARARAQPPPAVTPENPYPYPYPNPNSTNPALGLDTCYSILVGWKKDFPGESSFFIPKCLEKLVMEGNFGRKTGKGFYHWRGDVIGEVC